MEPVNTPDLSGLPPVQPPGTSVSIRQYALPIVIAVIVLFTALLIAFLYPSNTDTESVETSTTPAATAMPVREYMMMSPSNTPAVSNESNPIP